MKVVEKARPQDEVLDMPADLSAACCANIRTRAVRWRVKAAQEMGASAVQSEALARWR